METKYDYHPIIPFPPALKILKASNSKSVSGRLGTYVRLGKTGSLGPWSRVIGYKEKLVAFLHFYNTLIMTLLQGPKYPVLPTLTYAIPI